MTPNERDCRTLGFSVDNAQAFIAFKNPHQFFSMTLFPHVISAFNFLLIQVVSD